MEEEKYIFIAKYDPKLTPCWSNKPLQTTIKTVTEDGKVIGLETLGRQEGEKCPHCNRLWTLH